VRATHDCCEVTSAFACLDVTVILYSQSQTVITLTVSHLRHPNSNARSQFSLTVIVLAIGLMLEACLDLLESFDDTGRLHKCFRFIKLCKASKLERIEGTMSEWGLVVGRLIPYWLAVLCSIWILAFLYAWTSDAGYVLYNDGMILPVRKGCVFIPSLVALSPSRVHATQMLGSMNQGVVDWGAVLVGVVSPTVVASCICALLLTTDTLPAWSVNYFNKLASLLRSHARGTTSDNASQHRGPWAVFHERTAKSSSPDSRHDFRRGVWT
jgi:hypothetical protein